jgi:hypothetical protein
MQKNTPPRVCVEEKHYAFGSNIYCKMAPETNTRRLIIPNSPRDHQKRDCSIWKRPLAPQTVQYIFSVQVPETTVQKLEMRWNA